MPVLTVRINSTDPTLGRCRLHFFQKVVPFHFQNQVMRLVGAQANDEVRHVVVHLPVVKVRNGKSETRVLQERIDSFVLVYVVRCGLFPLPGICNDVVEPLFQILFCQRLAKVKNQFLQPALGSELVQIDLVDATGTAQREPPMFADAEPFHLDLGRNPVGLKPKRRYVRPIYSDAIADCLRVPFDSWKPDLELTFRWHGVNMMTLHWRHRRACCGLERNHLKRNAKHLRDLLSKLAVLTDFVALAAQSAADYLFEQ